MKKEPNLGKFNNVCDTFRHLVSQIRKPIRTNNYHQEKKFIGKTCKARKIYLNQYIYIYKNRVSKIAIKNVCLIKSLISIKPKTKCLNQRKTQPFSVFKVWKGFFEEFTLKFLVNSVGIYDLGSVADVLWQIWLNFQKKLGTYLNGSLWP